MLAKVKQKRVLAEHGLRRSQDRLGYLEAQSAKVNRANIKKAHDSRMNADRIYVNLPPPTESLAYHSQRRFIRPEKGQL